MLALVSRHLDGMAHLDHIEPVRVQRIERQILECRGRRHRTARQPADTAAGNERQQRRGDGAKNPFARPPHQPLDLEPLRHRLVGDGAVTRMQRLRHLSP